MSLLPILAGLSLIFFFCFSLALLLERIRIPGIIAPLLIGVVFKIIPFFSFLGQEGVLNCFDFLASLGVMFLLFFIGLEIDLPQMRRLSKVIIWLTVLNTLFPFIFGVGVVLFTALVAASAFSTLSVPILTSIILDRWKETLR